MTEPDGQSLEATLLHTISAWSDPNPNPSSGSSSGTVTDLLELEPGTVVGRYTILAKLGAGAMGVVYEAYDRDLDRRVAVKLLQRGSSDALLAEAQAMAKLAHAHVVAVFDVGTVRVGADGRVGGDARVFVAMEYVGGGTLGDWLDADLRSVDEILAVFVAAGEGLAAAHRAGLVHRDFKPDNVLMTGDGQAKVTDFGLAHSTHEVIAEAERAAAVRETGGSQTSPGGAQTGSASVDPSGASYGGATIPEQTLRPKARFCGTPAYMAPELFRGREASPRSDQFSFCVALWEALYGQRPYTAPSLIALGVAICEDRRDPPPREVVVPRRVLELLDRGLATEPADRFADMDALLATLRPPASKRSAGGAVTIAGFGVIAGLALGWGLLTRGSAEPDDPCVDAAASVSTVWSASARTGLREAIVATEAKGAVAVADQVEAELDTYASALAGARTQACERRQAQRDGADLDARRVACLDGREQALAGLLAALTTVDPAQVDRLVSTVAQLPVIAACDDPERLLAAVPPPADDQAEAVAELRAELARVRALISSDSPDALAAAEAVTDKALALGYPPLRAEARLTLGRAQLGREALDPAVATLAEGYVDALRIGHDEVAAEAAGELLFIVGVEQGQAEAGRRWADHGLALADRGGHARARAGVLGNLAVLDRIAGKLELAIEHSREVVELLEAELGPEHLDTGRAYGNHGVAQIAGGHPLEGLGWLERCAAIYAAKYGEDHPKLGPLYLNLGAARLALDTPEQLDRAKQDLDRALAIHEANQASAKDIAFVRSGLSDVAVAQADYPAALAHREFAVEAFRGYYGEVHPIVAGAELGLALAYLHTGEHARGLALTAKALATADAHEVGPELAARARLITGALTIAGGDPSGTELLEQGWAELSVVTGASVEPELAAWLDAHPELDPRPRPQPSP